MRGVVAVESGGRRQNGLVMDPLLGWFAAEALGPELVSRGLDYLRDNDWRKKLADRVADDLDFRVSRRRLRRWLDREDSWQALTEPAPERVVALVEAGVSVIRSRWPLKKPNEEALTSRSADLVAALVREFLAALDPSYATAIAHVREMRELRSIATDTSRILERLEGPEQFDAQLTLLPPGTDTQLRQLYASARSTAEQLAGLLSGDDALAIATQLVTGPPAWLESAPGAAWAALAEFTSAHRLRDVSATAAERAVDAGIPRSARWLAKAASQLQTEDQDRAAALLARAEQLADSSDLFVSAVRAATTDALNEMRDLLRDVPTDDTDALTLLSYRAQAELAHNDVESAIATLDAAVAMSPNAAGILLLAADAWLHVASAEDRVGRSAALQKAADFASRAREQRRRWNGPSFEATRRLCLVGTLALDWEYVLRVGLSEPDGDATAAEADDAEVSSRVFEAALALGRDDLARAVAERLAETSTDAFEISMSNALLVKDQTERVKKLRAAWDLAASEERRFRVQYLLARAGATELPGLPELEQRDPELALVLRATSHLARGDPSTAAELLRPKRNDSRRVAITLAEAYEQAGEVDDAVAALRGAAERFSDPLLLSFAAEVLYRAGRLEEAQEEANKAIALLTNLPGPRGSVRRLLIEVYMTASNWSGAEAQARALLSEVGDDAAVRWTLVIALLQQGQHDVAFAELSAHGLEPTTEFQALAWLDLHRRFASTLETLSSILQLAEAWASSEQVCAAALISAYEISRDLQLPDQTVRALHRLTDEFFAAHPDSQMFRRIQFEDVEELVSQLSDQLAPGASTFVELTTKVHLGQLPYGMLSAAAARPYAEALLRRAAGALLVTSPDSEADKRELRFAEAVLDGRAVVDASFLHTMALLPEIWEVVFGHLRSLVITDVSLHDLLDAQRALGLRATGSMGWDPRAGRPVLTDITEEQAELLATRSAWLADEARGKTEVVSWRRLQSFQDFELDRFGAWLTPLDLAVSKRLTFLADDYALRSLAVSVGASTCGSVALMQALVKAGHLSVPDFERALYIVRKNRGVDLPIDLGQMLALAAEDDDARAACLLDLSRPAFWRDLSAATNCFGVVLEALARVGDDWGVGAVQAATLGVVRAARPGFALGLVAGILGLAVVRTTLPADELLRASRRVVDEEVGEQIGDPLPLAVERVLTTLNQLGGAAMASQMVLRRFTGLSEEDRRVVTEVILSGRWQQEKP